jgi:DNA recombination protein RmuC
MIMSPHVFLLALGTIQALMRDARMREQAHAIQKEVGMLLKDVKLLAVRIGDLRKHFEKTSEDISEIEKPMARITGRAERIEKAELASTDTPKALS